MDSKGVNADSPPQLRPDLAVRLVDGELIILDRRRQRIHFFNETAGFIVQQCKGRESIAKITRRTASVFGVRTASIGRHVERTVDQIRALGLLESSPEAR